MPITPPSQPRPLTLPDGAEARQAWLDSLEDEIAVDTEIQIRNKKSTSYTTCPAKYHVVMLSLNELNKKLTG